MAAIKPSDFPEKLARRLGLDPMKTRRIELICDADDTPHAIVVMDVDDDQAAGILTDLEGADVSLPAETKLHRSNPENSRSDLMRPNLKLGDKARDKISGFSGVVVAITDWLNGCQRITIQPQSLHDGKPVDNYTFDAEQIELVSSEPAPASKPTGGPSISPTRAADPR